MMMREREELTMRDEELRSARRVLCYSSNGYWIDAPMAVRGVNRDWADLKEFDTVRISGIEYLAEVDHEHRYVQLTELY